MTVQPAWPPHPEPAAAHSQPLGWWADGTPVMQHTLQAGGLRLQAIDLGAIVTGLWVPDAAGRAENVTLGFDTLADYALRNPHFGTVVGRCANRIAGAGFELDGRRHQLPANDGPHCLHGGPDGFGKRLWRVAAPAAVVDDGCAAISFHLHSPDGDQGFPGALDATVTYTLGPGAQWRIDYSAVTDTATVVNLTQHAYFNLAGGGSALGHHLWLRASRYAPVDDGLIPLPQAQPVDGTPFDFRQPQAIDARLHHPHPQLLRARGYDHHFLLDRDGPGLQHVARLSDPVSGRAMDVLTTEPGLQLYSGNFLDGTLAGNGGRPLRQGDGICLETQHAPDSPNQDPTGAVVLRAGQRFTSTTVYRFHLSAH